MTRRALLALATAWCAACASSPPPPEATPTAVSASAPAAPEPAATPPSALPVAREPLPREAGGVVLGITRAAATAKLGELHCRDSAEGFQVCTALQPPAGTPPKLELFLFHDHAVSLAYQVDAGDNVWTFLVGYMNRFGEPTLNRSTEHDAAGRVHEIYGWKDDSSLFSVRFVWDSESADRKLTGTTLTLWDRVGFKAWEAERKHTPRPTPLGRAPT